MLFQKTAVLQGTRIFLESMSLPKKWVAGGCGLGVTHRINERDITEMIESIDGQGSKIDQNHRYDASKPRLRMGH